MLLPLFICQPLVRSFYCKKKKKVPNLASNGSGLDCGIWYPTALTPISPYRKDADSLLYYVKEGMLKMMSRHLTWHRNTPFPTSKKPPGSSFPWGLNLLMAVMLVFPQDPFFFFKYRVLSSTKGKIYWGHCFRKFKCFLLCLKYRFQVIHLSFILYLHTIPWHRPR